TEPVDEQAPGRDGAAGALSRRSLVACAAVFSARRPSPMSSSQSCNKSNLVLIGMPGSGKSTIGVILAKRTSHDFVDTDVVIQSRIGRSLQDVLDHEGYLRLREIEAE